MTLEHKDFLDNNIEVGDVVIYAGMRGQSPEIRLAKVLKLSSVRSEGKYPSLRIQGMRKYGDTWSKLQTSTISKLQNVLVLKKNLQAMIAFI